MTLGSRASLLVRRAGGFAIDCLILFVFVVASQAALVSLGLHPFVRQGAMPVAVEPAALHAWVFASTTAPFALYFTIAFVRGRTLGQKVLGIAVRSIDGAKLKTSAALVRSAVLLVPFELNHSIMFHVGPWTDAPPVVFVGGLALVWVLCAIYVALPLVRADGRSMHDLLAGSVVTRMTSAVS